MTGTADTEAAEFAQIYNLDVVVVPTNRTLIRTEYPDVVYRTESEKYDAAVNEIAECHERGQPTLVGTGSIENSEKVSKLLKRRGIPHNVLNAKNHAREADIIAQAGRLKAVTISTNMAGRGTDILLGGIRSFWRRPPRLAMRVRSSKPSSSSIRTFVSRSIRRSSSSGSARHRHRAPREPPHRQSASRPLGPSGRSGLLPFLSVFGGQPSPHLRLGPNQRNHGKAGHGRGRTHRAQHGHQGHRECPEEGGGLSLRHPQTSPGIRRRDEQAAGGHLRPAAGGHRRREQPRDALRHGRGCGRGRRRPVPGQRSPSG